MTKYMCLCGLEFSSKEKAEQHVEVKVSIGDMSPHIIGKKLYKPLIFEFFLTKSKILLRLLSLNMVYFAVVHHFKIQPSILEAMCIGTAFAIFAMAFEG